MLWASIEQEHAGTCQAAQVVLDRRWLSTDSAYERSANAADSMVVRRRGWRDRSKMSSHGVKTSGVAYRTVQLRKPRWHAHPD
jgi:hypothetical protein